MIGINRLLGLFCGLACLFALAFCACESAVPENCGDGSRLNPETEFCFGGQAYPKCGVGEYDPTVNKCENGVLKSKCGVGDKFYDPAAEFCAGDTVYSKCVGEEYDPASQKCESNVLKSQCGNDYYDTTAAFCVGDTVYSKCGGYTYDPAAATCENNVLKGKCGGIDYNPATENCSGGVISPITYTLTVSADPAVAGSVSREPDAETYNAGTLVTVTATPAVGYTFTGWTGASTATANVVQITMNGNKTLTANFQRQTVSPADTCAANPKPGCPNYVVPSDTCAANPKPGCPNYVPPITPTSYTLTVTRNPSYGGTTTPASSRPYIQSGTPVNISAVPRSGVYIFDRWTVESGAAAFANADSQSTTVTLTSDATIIANFKKIAQPVINTFTDGRDGKSYNWVQIGTQKWMAENMDFEVTDSKCYDNSADSCAKYGRLYDWATAMGLPSNCNRDDCSGQIDTPHPGICPNGWHIPTRSEWDTLVNFAGGSSKAGTMLKSEWGWNSSSSVPAGTDEYGFSALPGGYGYSNGFSGVGYGGNWWSATEYYRDSFVWSRHMSSGNEKVDDSDRDKEYPYSVRCVADE